MSLITLQVHFGKQVSNLCLLDKLTNLLCLSVLRKLSSVKETKPPRNSLGTGGELRTPVLMLAITEVQIVHSAELT